MARLLWPEQQQTRHPSDRRRVAAGGRVTGWQAGSRPRGVGAGASELGWSPARGLRYLLMEDREVGRCGRPERSEPGRMGHGAEPGADGGWHMVRQLLKRLAGRPWR